MKTAALSTTDRRAGCSLLGQKLRLGLTLFVFTTFACRGPSGPDDYASQERIPDPPSPIEDELMEGEERLSLGVMYEGPFTEEVVIDELNAHLYIYEETFSLSTFDGDLVEGFSSDQITTRGGAWWGGGVHWEQPRDLSGWGALKLSLKSSDEGFEALEIGMNSGEEERQARVLASDYGFIADGVWHELKIPLTALGERGLALNEVVAPLVLIGGASEAGERLLIDGLYLSSVDEGL